MRGLFCVLICIAATSIGAEELTLVNPLIVGYGAIAPQPTAAEQPRQGARIVFDITSEAKPDELNKGLESVARYLNLNAQAGNAPADIQLALVLHGPATQAALSDAAYGTKTGLAKNPNLSLARELKRHGVEVFVCGQSLSRNKFALSDVAAEFTVAASAMTVNANKQQDGYAYISIH